MTNSEMMEDQLIRLNDNNMELLNIARVISELPENKNPETLVITPSKDVQTYTGMYDKVSVYGEPNLVSENIKDGVNIFGVDGSAKTTDAVFTNGEELFYSTQQIKDLCNYVNEFVKLCDWKQFTSCYNMFRGNNYLTSLVIKDANPSNVTKMNAMFYGCDNVTNIDFGNMDTSNVTTMKEMFAYCRKLTDLNLSNFDTSNVTNMNSMFSGCSVITELDLSNFDTSNVTDMTYMFSNCDKLVLLNLNNFNTSNVTTMYYMFNYCLNLTELDLSNFDTRNVTNMSTMFYNCQKLTELDLSNFDTCNVTNMSSMFGNCRQLKSLDLSNFDTSNVTAMNSMFNYCRQLKSLDLSNFDTSNVTNMSSMFTTDDQLTSLNVSSFNTSKVTNMSSMFNACDQLTELDVRNFNTSNVTNMNRMFSSCYKLEELDLSSFDTSNVTDMTQMFYSCTRITKLDISNFTFGKVTSYSSMFTSIPSDCLIIVKGDTEKQWVLARRSDLTNVKTVGELRINSIEITVDNINTYEENKNGQVYITYNGGNTTTFYPEQSGYTLSITGNATIDENGLITLTDDAKVGDKLVITAVSTYDNSITATTEIEVVYNEIHYEINLNNGEWVASGETINGNIVYKSDANSYNINNGKSIATITTVGITNLKLYIRSYAESSYDYTEAFPIDTDAVRDKGLYTTKSKQSATNYIECNYELDGGTHTIQIMYSKDNSTNTDDDRGYFYIGEYN